MVRTYAVINAEIAEFEQELVRLRKEAAEAQAREIVEAKKRIADIMKEAGLTAKDFASTKVDKSAVAALKYKAPGAKTQLEPKYKDPVSGKTWTGRGRAPGWFNEQDSEKLRIPEAA